MGLSKGVSTMKPGHAPRLRCSEAVREGLEAEKEASQREQRSLTALGSVVSGSVRRNGWRCAQYHAPFPLIALFLTVVSPSYLFLTGFVLSSSEPRADNGVAVVAVAVAVVVAVVVAGVIVSAVAFSVAMKNESTVYRFRVNDD